MIRLAIAMLLASRLLLLCVAVPTASYTQIKEGFTGGKVNLYAGSPIACAGRGAVHETCGAFHWDETQVSASIKTLQILGSDKDIIIFQFICYFVVLLDVDTVSALYSQLRFYFILRCK